jgi:hypothetical protein
MWAIIDPVVYHWGAAAMKTGIAVLAFVVVHGYATAAPIQYAVDGLGLGTQLNLDSAQYREYRCTPSEQFDALTWCHKTRNDKDREGPYTAAYSILHARDGSVLYANRSQEPAFFSPKAVEDEIQRHARKIGAAPRIMKLPPGGVRNATIAVWGDVTLEQLDAESVRILADGKSPKKGLLIDFLGNLTRSAKEGLAIYRIAGGPGFLWAGSFDRKGRGTLRTVAVNASGLVSPAPERPAVAQSPAQSIAPEAVRSESAPTIETLQAELAIASRTIAELQAAKADAETALAEADRARVAAEAAQRELEQANVAENAQLDGTAAQLDVSGPAADAKAGGWDNVVYESIGGLLLALSGFAIGFLVNRRKAGGAKQQADEVATDEAGQSETDETEIISPALSPPIAISETAFETELEAQVVAINAAAEETDVTEAPTAETAGTQTAAAQTAVAQTAVAQTAIATDAETCVPESAERVRAPALV